MNELDWIQDAASGLRSGIEVELDLLPGQPDLADVLARARAIDADAVPSGLGVPADNSGEHCDDQPLDAELAMFAAALRDDIEDDVEDRAMQPTVIPARAPARRARGIWLAVAAAVIATVGLAIGSGDEHRQVEDSPASMASKSLDNLAAEGAWTQAHKPVVRKPGNPPDAAPPALLEEAEPEPEPQPAESTQTWKRIARPKRPSLDALETEAMAAWKAGNLSRAESLFRTIIRRAGRGTKAELAYGDLFALEKQRGGAAKQAQIWRQYLRRFPQGRYADDARAGLCMRTSGEAASTCWSKYLAKHPRGAHAKRAQRFAP
ncbi:MAG: tetratricopeptide repeat protein [Nannocystales bacterium]